jgi:MtfA peptidase
MTFFPIFIIGLVVVGLFLIFRPKAKIQTIVFPKSWRNVLEQKVLFYYNLSPIDKLRFENDVARFISNVRITGVHVEIDITDKLLVASSAAIPVFGFPSWDYTFLDEVLLYPSAFDKNFELNNPDEVITGMVGSGTMEAKMILSKPALHRGFENATDKQNVGVHEFIHLLDKEDGMVDGIPATLQNKKFTLPWLELIKEKTLEIEKNKSDINSYAATHEREFLAVAGEYFFERPQLLKQNHPELYDLLAQAFNQDTASVMKITKLIKTEIGRNDPCPCSSGKKYKKCCALH